MDYDQLKTGLNHSFIIKDKNIKKHIAANMESIANIASDKAEHEFL